ncbi:hypothetical protein F5Y07DRAFT_324956 [Xylaria sp. FL0933]|nr:hypothetical protein F5Y07DRAFT_324956 [Xylaria sp. FL0933]
MTSPEISTAGLTTTFAWRASLATLGKLPRFCTLPSVRVSSSLQSARTRSRTRAETPQTYSLSLGLSYVICADPISRSLHPLVELCRVQLASVQPLFKLGPSKTCLSIHSSLLKSLLRPVTGPPARALQKRRGAQVRGTRHRPSSRDPSRAIDRVGPIQTLPVRPPLPIDPGIPVQHLPPSFVDIPQS